MSENITTSPPTFSPASRPLTPIGENETDTTSRPGYTPSVEQNDEVASSAGSNVEEDGVTSSSDKGEINSVIVQAPACPAGDDVENTTATLCDATTATGDTIKTRPNKITEDVSFHVDADLLIQVVGKDGSKNVYFRVSSANFACASTVWRLDLYGSSNLRSSHDDPIPVDIGASSNPDALATLMNIVHYRFGEVPTDEIELSQLCHITQLTEKFMCTHLIRPWATTWIKNKELQDALARNGADDGTMSDMGVKIAWELGASSLFQSMGEAMIMTVVVNEGGDLIHGCHKNLKDLSLPPGMFDTILRIRFDIVSKMLASIQQPYDKLATKHRFCLLNEHQECDLLNWQPMVMSV